MNKKIIHSFCGNSFRILFIILFLSGCATTDKYYWYGRYDEYTAFKDKTWIKVDGNVYGAKPDNNGPIGGGIGYKNIITEGDFNVRTIAELLQALENAQRGEVIFIPGNIKLDITPLVYTENISIKIPEEVTLASDRGYKGSPGALIRSLAFEPYALIEVSGRDVRITGLRIEGPDKEQHLDHRKRSKINNELDRSYYYKFPVSDGILVNKDAVKIDNCEIWGWSHAAIYLQTGHNHIINNNYIHHNQRQGLGYGVSHNNSSSVIESNLFDFNRHSIAGSGVSGSGYIARNNVQLENSLSHCFDMHGGRDREDGTDIAGTSIVIINNTFLSEKKAVAIRGIPGDSATVSKNIFFQEKLSSGVITDWPLPGNVKVFDNKYGSRYLFGITIDE